MLTLYNSLKRWELFLFLVLGISCATVILVVPPTSQLISLLIGFFFLILTFILHSGKFIEVILFSIPLLGTMLADIPIVRARGISAFSGAENISVLIVDIPLLLLLFIEFKKYFDNREIGLHRDIIKIVVFFLSMILIGFLSLLLAQNIISGLGRLLISIRGLVLFTILTKSLSCQTRINIVSYGLLASLIIHCVFSFFQVFNGKPFDNQFLTYLGQYNPTLGQLSLLSQEDNELAVGRIVLEGFYVSGFAGSPYQLAAIIGLIGPLALSISWDKGSGKNRFSRQLSAVSFILSIVTIVFTVSRGGWIAFFVAIVFVIASNIFITSYLTRLRFSSLVLPLLGGGGLALYVLYDFVLNRFFNSNLDLSLASRALINAEAIKIFMNNPLLGVGSGNFGVHSQGIAHNIFLFVAGENGMIGLLLFLGLLTMIMKISIKMLVDRENSSLTLAIGIGLIGGLIASMVHGMVDWLYFKANINFTFWLIVGVLAAQYINVITPNETMSSLDN